METKGVWVNYRRCEILRLIRSSQSKTFISFWFRADLPVLQVQSANIGLSRMERPCQVKRSSCRRGAWLECQVQGHRGHAGGCLITGSDLCGLQLPWHKRSCRGRLRAASVTSGRGGTLVHSGPSQVVQVSGRHSQKTFKKNSALNLFCYNLAPFSLKGKHK